MPPSAARSAPVLLLDFDGVLAPLGDDPAAVRADPDCLAAVPAGWRVAVVSGRDADDLLARLTPWVPDAVAGDHGLEIRLRGAEPWRHPEAVRLRDAVRAAAAALEGEAEYKALTAKVYGGRRPGAPPPGVRYLAGRRGTDVLPAVDWDKGSACLWLLERWAGWPRAAYLGDEATDEEAFRRLAPRGVVTVRVAPDGPTAARLTLAGQSAVAAFLRSLTGGGAGARADGPGGGNGGRPEGRGPAPLSPRG